MSVAAYLRLFGPPRLERPATVAALLPQRPHQLLAYLACRRAWVARDALAQWLWPEHEPTLARRNLRKVLTQARAFAAEAKLEQQGDCVRWVIDSDHARFESACQAQRVDEVLAQPPLALWQGMEHGLSGAAADWLAAERLRLAQRWRELAISRLRAAAPDAPATLTLAERMLALDPLDEEATLALARARARLGQRPEALRLLDEHAARVREQFDIEPSAAWRNARVDLTASAAPVVQDTRPAAPPRAAADAFVGRRSELLQMADLLMRSACRLLTITGPGGIGKTGLAEQARHAVAQHFPDGVVWIATADLRSTGDVAQRLIGALGLKPQGESDLWRLIGQAVRDRRLLWVLDSTEHLPGLAAALDPVLAQAQGLKVIATSRARIGAAGEWLLPLEGLPLPDADESDLQVLRAFDAVRLFEARSLAASPAFRLDGQQADVVRLLQAVDGMPLAIELAAPWTRLLPVAGILAEVLRSPQLLGEAPRPAAGQGLRETFAHSWRLLSADERQALGCLTHIPDEVDPEMAAQVADAPLPLLAALCDKSLVQVRPGGRFGLHPLIRQYAGEWAPDPAPVRQRHARHVARRLERLGETIGEARWAEIARSITHARAAWQWALDQRDGEVVAASARALMLYHEAQGLWDQGLRLFIAATQAFDEGTPSHARPLCASLRCLGTLQYRAGQLAAAEQTSRQALRLARRLKDMRALKGSLNTLGLSLWQRGGFAAAQPYFREALRLAERDADAPGMAVFRANLAMVHTALGQYEAALQQYEQVLDSERAGRPADSLATTLNNAANARRALGRHEAAAALLEEARQLCETHALRSLQAFVLVNLGALATDRRQADAARDWLGQALAAARAHGEAAIRIEAQLWLAVLATDEQQWADAAQHLQAAWAPARDLRSAALQGRWLLVFARWSALRGHVVEAAQVRQWVDRQPGVSALDRDDALRRLPPALLAAMTDATAPAPADGTAEGVWAWARERLVLAATPA